MAFKIGNTLGVMHLAGGIHHVRIRHPVLSDIERQSRSIVPCHAAQEEGQPLGIDLPPHIGLRQIAANTSEAKMRLAGIRRDHRAGIVVAAGPVERRADQSKIILIPVRHVFAEQCENLFGIASLECRLLEPAVVDAVEQMCFFSRQLRSVDGNSEFLVQHTSEVLLTMAPHHLDRPAMRQLHVMHRPGGGGKVAQAWGMMPPVMAEEGNAPGLVDRGDAGKPVAKMTDYKVGIIGEPAGYIAVLPAAVISVALRQVPVIERRKGLQTALEHRIEKPIIEGQPVSVHFFVRLRQKAWPGKGKTIGTEAAIGDEVEILGITVVMIAGHGAVTAVGNGTGLSCKTVPVGGTTPPVGSAFNLIARGCDPKDHVRREAGNDLCQAHFGNLPLHMVSRTNARAPDQS